MRRSGWRLVVVVLLCLSAMGTAVGADPAETSQSVIADSTSVDRSHVAAKAPRVSLAGAPNGSSFDPDSVLMQVAVQETGTAVWRVEYHFQLPTDDERASFQSFSESVEANRSAYTDRFRDRIEPSVRTARRETGRAMAVSNVSVTVRRQRLAEPTGIVTYRFTWQAFARGNESALRVGDAIRGFYIGPSTTLTLTWPDGYRAARTLPEPDSTRRHRLSWQGELGFGTDEPSVLVTERSTGGNGTTTSGTAVASETSGGMSPVLLGAAGLLLAVLGTGGVVAARQRGDDTGEEIEESDDETEDSVVPNTDLLSDEERALSVVEDHDGRIKQQQLADACDWGNSKVSRVVSNLREDDKIDVFRLGRENVISLPEEDDAN